MKNPQCTSQRRFFLLLVLLSNIHAELQGARWREITPEEMAQTKSLVDPEHGAEVLFSEGTLKQELSESGTTGSWRFYSRIKVFDERGVEEISKFELPYSKGREIRNVEGRTVKPDGTEIILERDDVFDKEVIRAGRTTRRATSFAFPNLEPGDIIELQYSQRTGSSAYFVEMGFQGKLPAQRVYRKLTPFREYGIGSKIVWFQIPGFKGEANRDGSWEFELTNLPAETEEPFSVPDLHLSPTVVLYYYNDEPKADKYWIERARELYKDGRRELKPSREIEDFVKSHTQDSKTPLEKLKKVYLYCQSELTNLDYSYGVYTAKEKQELAENYSPKDTFTRGYGTPENINHLFGSMARALGFNAEKANTNDIRRLLFTEGSKYAFALRDECAAVEINGEWNFFNPGSPFVPFESLDWWACGSYALIGHPKEGELAFVPMQKAEFSIKKTTGDFAIDESGTLKGRVNIELSGFQDLDMKEELAGHHTYEEEQDWVIHQLKKYQPQAKASNFAIINRNSVRPMQIAYDLEIPDYADVTGKRIFVQPAVFQKAAEPVFTSDKRQGDILFPYPWTESDDITISIPQDYALEEGSAPQPVNLEPIGNYSVKLGLTKSNKIKYQRTFSANLRWAEKKYYDSLKDVFSLVNQLDQHALTFKRKEEE